MAKGAGLRLGATGRSLKGDHCDIFAKPLSQLTTIISAGVVLAAGLESALTNLHIKNRNDPATTAVAKLIIQLARDGECDPTRLAIRAIEIVRGSS